MARAVTKTDIANMALDLIASRNILDLDNPATETERFVARWYENEKRSLLRSFIWPFAKKRASLSRNSTPAFEYSDAYKLPNDYIRFLEINNYSEYPGEKTYEFEGDLLLINNTGASSIDVKYIANVDTISLFDPLFVELLAYKLALRLAYKITVDKALKQSIAQDMSPVERKAVSIFGQERTPKKKQMSAGLLAHNRVRPRILRP